MAGHVLLYDGECTICRGSVAWVRWLDRRCSIEAVPYQLFDFARRPDLDRDACAREMHLLLADGRVLRGGAAVRWLLRLRLLSAPLGLLASLPVARGVFDAAYAWFAQRRRRLGGSCPIHAAPRTSLPHQSMKR